MAVILNCASRWMERSGLFWETGHRSSPWNSDGKNTACVLAHCPFLARQTGLHSMNSKFSILLSLLLLWSIIGKPDSKESFLPCFLLGLGLIYVCEVNGWLNGCMVWPIVAIQLPSLSAQCSLPRNLEVHSSSSLDPLPHLWYLIYYLGLFL